MRSWLLAAMAAALVVPTVTLAPACGGAAFTIGDGGTTPDAGSSFCASQKGLLFCNDFDEGAANYGFDGTEIQAGASMNVDSTVSVSPPDSLVASSEGFAHAWGRARLPGRYSEVVWTFDLLGEELPEKGMVLGSLSFETP